MMQTLKKHLLTIKSPARVSNLEPEFWTALEEIAAHRGMTVDHLVAEIDEEHLSETLVSSLRVYVLDYFQTKAVS